VIPDVEDGVVFPLKPLHTLLDSSFVESKVGFKHAALLLNLIPLIGLIYGRDKVLSSSDYFRA
jgi:hypothetical protein